jgi:succinate dehydrogenase/fumarate reductase flavoprotein subunit
VIKIPGHSFARHLVGENWRGSYLVLPLKRKAAASGVRFLEKMKVTSLLMSGSSVRGAACISEDGIFTAISAGAVILATGGFGRLFQNTNNAPGITGDGHALAAMVGATLQDMEFVQYYPTCLGNRGSRLLLYEKILAQDGVILRNSRGEDILAKNGYDASGNVTRDQLARVIMKEILEDPERRGSVDMDLGGMSPEAADALSALLPAQWSKGVRMFQVTPTAHFCMGGVKVDSHGETAVTGLFAVGEVTAGAHGANRLGGNALAEAIAMGSLVGSAAAATAGKAPAETGTDTAAKEEHQRLESLFKAVGADPRDLIRDLKEVMWLNAGIIRDRQSLGRALERIVDWKDMAQVVQTPGDLIRCLELGNMLLVGEMVCRSALERTESRGAHFRSDYPQENDDSWLVNIQIRKAASGLVLERVPVPDNGGTR